MGTINHKDRAHALLSASGSHRWINCTPSAKLEESYGKNESSVYASEGTLAHEIAELTLRSAFSAISDAEFSDRLEELESNELFDPEMLDYVGRYAEFCIDEFNDLSSKSKLHTFSIEQKLDISRYVPESFGTADFLVVSDNVLSVIDLKYGKGVPVNAEWNTQLMMYGLGALDCVDLIYDIKSVRLNIVQPRIDNISTFEISVDDLMAWANETLIPAAKKAIAGEGEINPGAWCKFCGVKARCRALYEQQCTLADTTSKDAKLLSDAEVATALTKIPLFEEWATALKSYALDQAVTNNKVWPGFKLVEGKSNRKWIDPDTIGETILQEFPVLSEDQVYRKSVETITNIEKAVGKKVFAAHAAKLVVKPAGAPTLVPESDKRAPINKTASAQDDFKDII